jgi:hypothetical protein
MHAQLTKLVKKSTNYQTNIAAELTNKNLKTMKLEKENTNSMRLMSDFPEKEI